MTRENIDKEIKKKVQAMEKEIPPELEKTIMKELEQMRQVKPFAVPGISGPGGPLFRRPMVAAASVLLGVFLLAAALSFLFHPRSAGHHEYPEQNAIMVDAAWLEGKAANTFIIEQKDPDLTIVWIEKI